MPTLTTPAALATITYAGCLFELRNPAGGFVCQGPLGALVRIAAANGWGHVVR